MAGRDFIRDELGRFAKQAGRRAAKKLKKTAEQKAAELQSAAVEQLKATRLGEKLDKAVDDAKELVKKADKEWKRLERMGGGDSELELGWQDRIKAHEKLAKALRAVAKANRGE